MSTVTIILAVWAIVATGICGFVSSAARLRRLNDARNRDEGTSGP